jgi:hypothetical protein
MADDRRREGQGRDGTELPMRVRISSEEFQQFCELQQRRRWDWPAVFSSNPNGDVWAFTRYGYTPLAERENLRGLSRLLDIVADSYERQRPDCGRFFIDQRGAFFKADSQADVQFITWDSPGIHLQGPTQLREPRHVGLRMPTFEELELDRLARVRERKR